MREVSFIGFGEAGSAFTSDWPSGLARPRAFDIKTDSPQRDQKLREYARADVYGYDTPACMLRGTTSVLSLVTADRALDVARDYAPMLDKGTLWFDMNSIAPQTKQAAAKSVEAAGGRYVDVALMAPVHPQKRAVPLLVSGPHSDAGLALLALLGFTNIRKVEGGVGAASAIKMIRSVMVKGLEALTTECVLAAEAAGVRDEVFASLNASWPGTDWTAKADYNLDRMIVHGERRAAEMEEVVATLDALGTGSAMARATAGRQREIGARKLLPVAGLSAKIDAVLGRKKDEAA